MSIAELLLIFGVIMAVFTPKKLPMLAQHAALIMRRWHYYQNEMRAFLRKTILDQQLKENEALAMQADSKYPDEKSNPDHGV